MSCSTQNRLTLWNTQSSIRITSKKNTVNNLKYELRPTASAADDYYPLDLTMFVETIKFNRRLAQREPFKSILTGESSERAMYGPSLVARSGTEVNPGPEVQTDEQIAGVFLRIFFFLMCC